MKTSGLSLEQAPPEDIPFRFFLTAPLFGIFAGILLIIQDEKLFKTILYFDTIALTHLITLGWLALIMMGAFYQMVPVLIGGIVPFLSISRVVHLGMVLGICSLIIGLIYWLQTLLIIAGGLLILSLIGFLIPILIALFQVKGDRPSVIGLRISAISLAVVVVFGISILGSFAGLWQLPIARLQIRLIHILFAGMGWIGCLIMGVGFQVIPMFYLTESFPVKRAYGVLIAQIITLVAFPSVLFFTSATSLLQVIAILPSILGFATFTYTIARLLYKRKRKIVDVTISFWRFGMICISISIALLFTNYYFKLNELTFLLGGFFFIGFAVSITNGMLYKIVPFLIWLHRFSPLLGKVKTPLMKDICPKSLSERQWHLFLGSTLSIFVSIAFQWKWGLKIGGFGFAISSALLFYNLVKAVRIETPEVPKTPEMPSFDEFQNMFPKQAADEKKN
ncbi:MAG: hypothetical protein ACI86H_002515 [bacterium]|jgi:hypothetical protein